MTPRQARAFAALLFASSVSEAARTTGIPRRTLTRWMRRTDFRAALVAAREEVVRTATARAVGACVGAVQEMSAIFWDEHSPVSARIRAARAVLHMATAGQVRLLEPWEKGRLP
jgi:transposase-like protein